MTRQVSIAAFLLGIIMSLWMGSAFVGSNFLALIVTFLIIAVFIAGFVELANYQKVTSSLQAALGQIDKPVDDLEQWVASLDTSLQNPVQLRIEGERVALPTPVLTPYLVGLLVMLGLLGTFVGMVDTLKGAVTALEGSTELEAIRSGLTAPIQGLGLAFGTSVAGITASAMLGLVSNLSRRDRMHVSMQLDQTARKFFSEFSLSYQRRQIFMAVTALSGQLDNIGDKLETRLSSSQNDFHESVKSVYTELADSVGESLKASAGESGKLVGESLQPIVTQAMESISSSMQDASQQWVEKQASLDSERLELLTSSVHDSQQQASQELDDINQKISNQLLSMTEKQVNTVDSFQSQSKALINEMQGMLSTSEKLLASREAAEKLWLEQQETRASEISVIFKQELEKLIGFEEERGQKAVEQLKQLEDNVAIQLGKLGTALEEPMMRLIETASETPRAAADVIGKLRDEMSKNIEKDNLLLDERKQILDDVHDLTKSISQASSENGKLLHKMAEQSSSLMQEVGKDFKDSVNNDLEKINEVVDHFAVSAADLGALGEAFGQAVKQFTETSAELTNNLSSIEKSLSEAGARSDEQLAYYVAQARELIDHSLMSQKEIFEELKKIRQQDVFEENKDNDQAEVL